MTMSVCFANDALLDLAAVAAAERARFEFANAQLWADLEAIAAAVAVQWGEAA